MPPTRRVYYVAEQTRYRPTIQRSVAVNLQAACVQVERDARQALADLRDYKLAILSNGSTEMLTPLFRNTALNKILDPTISIDSQRIFKPSPEAYSLVEARLGIAPADLRFI